MWVFYFLLGTIFGYFVVRLYYDVMYDVIEDPSVPETPTRTAYIKKIGEGKFFVYEKETDTYLCKFVNWEKLGEQLGEWDNKVTWLVEHGYSEIDRKKEAK